MLEAGDKIPSFTLKTGEGQPFTQDEIAGKRVLLCFYPAAFSGVCTHQLSGYQERIDDFKQRGVEIYGISVDSHHSQRVFQEHLGAFDITFLADFHPKGAVAESFGTFRDDGINDRSVFLVSSEGTVEWAIKMPTPGESPTADEVLAAIDAVS